jgi:Flp pilus assembly protein TadD
VRLRPDDSSAWGRLSEVLAAQRRGYDAIAAAERGLSLAPDDPDSLNTLAYVLIERDPGRAEELCRKSLAHDPNQPLVLNNLGGVLQGQDKTEAAALAFKASMLLDPS